MVQSAFEKLYKSRQFEEEIIPVKMVSDELVVKLDEQANWFNFFDEPDMDIQKEDTIEVNLEAGQEILEEVKETGQLIPLMIISGLLVIALVTCNLYWAYSIWSTKRKAKEDSNQKTDVEKPEESSDKEEDSSMIQYENEPSRMREGGKGDMEDLSDDELSLCCKYGYGEEDCENDTPEAQTEEQKSDAVSESSVKIEFEIQTIEARDVTHIEPTNVAQVEPTIANATPEDPTLEQDSDEKDTRSELSIQIEMEIETFEAKDVAKFEPTEIKKKEKTLKCMYCEKKFEDENGRRTHCLSKHRYDIRNCSTDENQLDSGIETSLENISNVGASNMLPTNIVSIESDTRPSTRKSVRRKSGGKNRKGLPLTIPCDSCDGFFATNTGLESHKSSKH